ncbi:Tricyclene synthase [Bertholletia excelsa]
MAVHMICIGHPCYLHSLRNFGNGRRSCSSRTRLQIYCSTTVQDYSQNEGQQLANYQPTSRTYDNAKSFKIEYDVDESRKQRARRLKEEVEAMLGEEDANPLKILELIDDLHRLGVSHLFDNQINRAFQRIVSKQTINHALENSLHATCLFFRLSREYGYDVSQDVLEKFKDGSGKFKCPSEDVQLKAFLSLYEASHLALEGENIMDEARAFTSAYLKGLKSNISSGLIEEIDHALELPPHCRALRLEARRYINAYGKRSDANRLLLELAELDFNMVQSTLQRELRDMSRWWENIGLERKLSFAKIREMECFFWAVGMVPEPQFSECRKGLAKALALISAIDDVYDVYGSLEELQLFTHAVERWDLDVLETLPDYMKLSFLALYNTVNEMAYDTLEEKDINIVPHLSRAWADLCKAFLVEANWRFKKHTPTLEEYLDNGWISVSGVVLLTHAYFLVSKNITKNSLEKLDIYHPLIRDSSLIFRLCNDLGSSKAELERGESANSIPCYMKESGVSEEVARKHIRSLADEAWKKMNKHRLANDSPFEKPLIETAINLARTAELMYQNGDGLRDPDMHAKNRFSSVILQPLELTE